MLYVGGGVIKAEASTELLDLADETGAPVVTTLMARGAFPDGHRQNLGMPGMHGTVAAVAAMQKSDLLIALGARFDDRVTGDLSTFAPEAKIVHADIDPAEIGKNRPGRRADRGRRPRGHRRAHQRAAGRRGRTHAAAVDEQLARLVGAARALARDVPAGLRRPRRRHAVARVRHRADRRDRRPGRDLRRGRRAAPDVGGAVHPLREAAHVAQLRRRRDHGLRRARGDGRQGRHAGHHGVVHRRRRLLPDDQPGARHLRDRGHPDQGRGHQQRQPRHGPPVADPVLRGALLAAPSSARTSTACPTSSCSPRRSGAWGCAARPRTTSTGSSRRPWRSTTARWSSTSPSAPTRRSGRWSRPGRATTRSWPPATSGRCSTTPRPAARTRSRRRTRTSGDRRMTHPHPVGPRRGQARRARPHLRPVLPARLQHPVARRGPHRGGGDLAHDDLRDRRRLPPRAGDEAAQQARARHQDRRAGADDLGAARAA